MEEGKARDERGTSEANWKPGDSVRGVKRKLSDSEIIGGIKKQKKWRGSQSKE